MADEAGTPSAPQKLESGIRGWLLAFVLWIGVIGPLWTVGFTVFMMYWLELKNPADAALMRNLNWDVLLWVVTLIRAGIRVAAGLLMWVRLAPSSVWFALAALWLSGPLLILSTSALVEGELNIAGLVRSALIALAWTLFLFMSRRVKITYRFRVTG